MHRATATSILAGAVVPEVPARAARRALLRRARHAAPVWWRRLGRGALAALAGALIAALTVAAMGLAMVLA